MDAIITPANKESKVHSRRDPSSTNCSKCGSDDTRSFQMVYEQGSSEGRIRAASYDGENFGVIGGTSANQSFLASKLAPPEKPEFRIAAVLALSILTFIFTAFFGRLFIESGMLLLFFCLALSGLATWFFNKHEGSCLSKGMEEYSRVFSVWQRSWICLRCGNTWRRITSSK